MCSTNTARGNEVQSITACYIVHQNVQDMLASLDLFVELLYPFEPVYCELFRYNIINQGRSPYLEESD